MTRAQLKSKLVANFGDVGSDFYDSTDLNDSIQDGYDEIAVRTSCISKTTSIVVVPNLSYYNLSDLVADFYKVIAIFNPQTNLFLDDSMSLRGFDTIRTDWELWRGNFQFWAPVSPSLIAMCPCPAAVTTSLTLYYAAQAPTLASDGDSFLLDDDLVHCLEHYVTADLLAAGEEFTKAQVYFQKYEEELVKIEERYKDTAKADLMLVLGGQ